MTLRDGRVRDDPDGAFPHICAGEWCRICWWIRKRTVMPDPTQAGKPSRKSLEAATAQTGGSPAPAPVVGELRLSGKTWPELVAEYVRDE